MRSSPPLANRFPESSFVGFFVGGETLSSENRIQVFFHSLSRYGDLISKIICFPTGLTFFLILLIQVLFRYILLHPIEWYLEVVGITYMWSLFMGITIAFKAGSHVQFQFLFTKLSGNIQRYLSLLCQVLALFFFVFMVIYGVRLVITSKDYILPAINLSQGWKFVCVPISGAILVLHAVELIVGSIIDVIHSSETKMDFYRRS